MAVTWAQHARDLSRKQYVQTYRVFGYAMSLFVGWWKDASAEERVALWRGCRRQTGHGLPDYDWLQTAASYGSAAEFLDDIRP
jgi:hypothetical protein